MMSLGTTILTMLNKNPLNPSLCIVDCTEHNYNAYSILLVTFLFVTPVQIEYNLLRRQG
jgi:hypothetical protein